MKSLLLVDDEPVISVELQKALQKARYHVELVADVTSAQRQVEKTHFDLIIIEVNAKESANTPAHPANGSGFIRELRSAGVHVPILVHSTLSDEFYLTGSLDAGADDYIVKRSASFRVLLTRIAAHFRRDERLTHPQASAGRWMGTRDYRLDRTERKLSVGHVSIDLNVRETKVMEMLTSNPAKIFSTEEIMKKVWGNDIRRSPHAVRSLISRLRNKFKNHEVEDLIENVRDEGYRLVLSSVTHQ